MIRAIVFKTCLDEFKGVTYNDIIPLTNLESFNFLRSSVRRDFRVF